MSKYIEKQDIIKAFDYENLPGGIMNLLERILCDIPPADVWPVVRGSWIEYDDDYGAYSCSQCGQNAPEDTQWDFCPSCGADMRGDDG